MVVKSPNLITTLINIVLAPGSVDEPIYAGPGTGADSDSSLSFRSSLIVRKTLAIKYGKSILMAMTVRRS